MSIYYCISRATQLEEEVTNPTYHLYTITDKKPAEQLIECYAEVNIPPELNKMTPRYADP